MPSLFRTAEAVAIRTTADEVVFQDDASVIPDSFSVHFVSGIAAGEFGLLDSSLGSPLADVIDAETMSSSFGEWLAIAKREENHESNYLLFADSYGYAPLFYSLVPGQALIVSDSFNGVSAKLKEFGVQCHLNVENYLATLASWRSQFARPAPHETMAREIRILPLDRVLHVGVSGVIATLRSAVFSADSELSYDELLVKGNEYATKVVSKIGALPDIPKGLLLSGGVDSRLVLSLILAAGMKDAFDLRTSDPRDYSSAYSRRVFERDAQIANEIREHFDMNWMVKSKIYTVPVSFQESLWAHQSFRSNFSYTFQPTKTIAVPDTPMITLRGGGGEILRSTGTGWGVDETVQKERSLQNLSIDEQFVGWYMQNANWDNDLNERISEFIYERMGDFSGETLVEKLNIFYLNSRNRSHFGHARASQSRNEIPLQFLSNAFYLEASKKIPFVEKADGRMVADIFRLNAPQLLDFPFESEKWHARLASEDGKRRIIDSNQWLTEFDALKTVKNKVRSSVEWAPRQRGEHSQFDAEEASISYLKTSFQLIEEFAGDELKQFHRHLWAGVRNGRLKIGPLVSKVASAVDLVFPSVPLGTSVTLETHPPFPVLSLQSTSLTPPIVCQDGWNNVTLPDVEPVLRISGGEISLDARPTNGGGPGVSYAFYLYKDGVRLETKWYEETPGTEFTSRAEPGTYHGRVFVKLPHLQKPSLIRETEAQVFPRDF